MNLLNLMALPGKERAAVLGDVRRRASRVARQHGATTSDLTEHRNPADDSSNAGTDQCFKVLCAALLLADSLDDLNEARHLAARPELKFRFGVHVTTRRAMLRRDTSSDAIADTVVLSAVAPEGSIAASREAFERLPRPERFIVDEQSNPILRTLSTAAPRQLRDRLGCGRCLRRGARSSSRVVARRRRLHLDAVDFLKSARQHVAAPRAFPDVVLQILHLQPQMPRTGANDQLVRLPTIAAIAIIVSSPELNAATRHVDQFVSLAAREFRHFRNRKRQHPALVRDRHDQLLSFLRQQHR